MADRDHDGAGGGDRAAENLEGVLERHRRWLETGGVEGARAELSGADLRETDLRGADLRRGDLTGSRLLGADLRRADLREAELGGARGLENARLGGAVLTGAELPDDVGDAGPLDYVKEASGLARPLFRIVIAACVFAFLIMLSTPDRALLLNESFAFLPSLRVMIPAASWFWAPPVALLALYLYLHLQLAGIWRALSQLPAVFADGTTLASRLRPPWLVLCLVGLRERRWPRGLAEWVAALLVWAAVPLTLLGFWARYLRVHDWPRTIAHVVLVGSSVLLAIGFYRQARALLRGDPFDPAAGRHRRVIGFTMLTATLLGTSAVAILRPELFAIRSDRIRARDVPWFLVATLSHEDLTGKDLRRVHMRYARANDVKLAEADLQDALLLGADLQRADFSGAHLEKADVSYIDADSASFRGACLRAVRAEMADLQRADFRGAYLGKASLHCSELVEADFRGANLQGVDLAHADLTEARLEGAEFGCAVLHRREKGASLRCADLAAAKLIRARLDGAVLDLAKGLTQAQLDQACGDAVALPEGLKIRSCTEVDWAQPARGDSEPTPTPEANPCAQEWNEDRWVPAIDGSIQTETEPRPRVECRLDQLG